MVSQIHLILQPKNQQQRQIDFICSFIALEDTSFRRIILYQSEDVGGAHTFESNLPEELREILTIVKIPSLDNILDRERNFSLQNGDYFLISGTKLQFAVVLSEVATTSLTNDLAISCVHELPDHSGFDIHKYIFRESRVEVELESRKREHIVPASKLLLAQNYTFDVVDPGAVSLTELDKKLLNKELDSPMGGSESIHTTLGQRFESVITFFLAKHERVIETIMNCKIHDLNNVPVREEDVICTLDDGTYLFISCKFGSSKTLRELRRLSNIAISRNLQPKERWRPVLALRHSKLKAAKEFIESEGFAVDAFSLATVHEFLGSIRQHRPSPKIR